MKCSWCAKPITFFRSLVDTQFCCAEHKEQEMRSMRQLALERLQQNALEMDALIGKSSSPAILARSA